MRENDQFMYIDRQHDSHNYSTCISINLQIMFLWGYYSLFKSGIRITEIHALKLCSSFSKMTRHSWGILFYLSKCSFEAGSRFYFLVSVDSSADNFLFINKEDCVRSRSTYLKSYWAFSILCSWYVHKVYCEALCESGSSPWLGKNLGLWIILWRTKLYVTLRIMYLGI